ncbi:hypothetical protein ABPG72_013673 [Tetrahymena utriculariae]
MIKILFIISLQIQILNAQLSISDCGYYADQNDPQGIGPLCKFTLNGCRLCNNGACVQCLDGFYLNSSNQCQSCSYIFGQIVAACSIDINSNTVQIDSCIQGYYLNTDKNICFPCSHSCQQCINDFTCIKCYKNNFLLYQQCYPCQVSNFKNCCFQNPIKGCNICKESYYKDDQNRCMKCIQYCLTCSNGNSCDQCQKGYFYDQNQMKCIQNPQNCDQACITSQQKLKCVNCIRDYVNDNMFYPDLQGQCQPCQLKNCNTCSNQFQCQQCLQGYTLMQSELLNSQNQQCYNCQTNCSRCQMVGALKICYQCMDGSQPVNGQCLKQLQFQWNVIQSQQGQYLHVLNIIILMCFVCLFA